MPAPVVGWEVAGSSTSPWDTLYIGEHRMPGTWTVRCTRHKNIDVKTKRGSDGARTRDRGVDPVRCTMQGIVRANDGEWERLSPILQELMPARGARRGPVTITHPAAQLYKLAAIEIETVEGPDIDNGLGTFVIYAIEWIKQPKKRKPANEIAALVAPAPEYHSDGSFPNWQRHRNPWFSYEPPSIATDLDLLAPPEFLDFGAPAPDGE